MKIKKCFLFILLGLGMIFLASGIAGIIYTYTNVARENITTPPDARIPNIQVRGPISLKVQADIIRKHTLHTTNNKTYAEMPQKIAQINTDGKEVVGPDGKPVMIPNETRNMWITATTLITALNLGLLAYGLSAFSAALGCTLLLLSTVLLFKKNEV